MSEFTEINDGFTHVTTYFKNLSGYLGGTGSESYIDPDQLGFEDLLTYTTSQRNKGAGTQVGLAQECVHSLASIAREIGMLNMSKAQLYISASGEAQQDMEFYENFAVFASGSLLGTPTNGSQS